MAFVGSVGFFFPSLKKRKWICGKFPLPKQLSFANMLQLGWSEGAAVKWRRNVENIPSKHSISITPQRQS